MKQYPIILSGQEVRDILDGRKTQVRRPLSPQPVWLPVHNMWGWQEARGGGYKVTVGAIEHLTDLGTYGAPGAVLWAREAIYESGQGEWFYAADDQCVGCRFGDENAMMEWVMHIDRPRVSPMHMPKWASRLSLKVLDIRIQHVQDISENDARAEGAHPEFELDVDAFLRDEHVDFAKASTYKLGYKHDWAERYETKPHLSWATNPIVWAVTFKRHRWYE